MPSPRTTTRRNRRLSNLTLRYCAASRLRVGNLTDRISRVRGARLLNEPVNVRFGSLADIAAALPNVCFTPKSGHRHALSAHLRSTVTFSIWPVNRNGGL